MKNSVFDTVKISTPEKNVFDLSHEHKLSLQMGKLTPIFCQDVLPGDTFTVQAQTMLRFAPMLAPIMHRVNVFTHFFFVPNRILWSGWQDFITGGQTYTEERIAPYIKLDGEQVNSGSLANYIGLPVSTITGQKINALPFAAYFKIYDDYYRDQNLIEPKFVELTDGNNTSPDLLHNILQRDSLLSRAWEHDYFTSCLPFTQKGDDVMISVSSETSLTPTFNYSEQDIIRTVGNTPVHGGGTENPLEVEQGSLSGKLKVLNENDGDWKNASVDNSKNLSFDLSGTNLITVNELRVAMQLQKWLELNARGGSRYIETILVHFGVTSSDARLQRPEYLGGGISKVAISEVLQNSQSDDTPQGTMAGHGITVGESHNFKAFFEEHGFVIGIMTVMPKTAYQQGIPRMFSKLDKLDYYWKTFANLGEQAILNKEVYVNHSAPEKTFGYLPRYSEYKYINNRVSGDFATDLDFWHLGRIFEEDPNLNEEFINCDASNRIFAVTSDEYDHLWCHVYFDVWASRPIPFFSTPSSL